MFRLCVFLFGFFIAVSLQAKEKTLFPVVKNKTVAAAVVIKTLNDVLLQEQGQTGWRGVARGQIINAESLMQTGATAFCIMRFLDNTIVRIQEKSQIKISMRKKPNEKNYEEKSVFLEYGKFGFNVNNRPGEEFRFVSPTSVASIKGTRGTYDQGPLVSTLLILEGKGELRASDGNSVPVKAGQIGTSTKQKAEVRDATSDEQKLAETIAQMDTKEDSKDKQPEESKSKQTLLDKQPDAIIIKVKDAQGNIKTIRVIPPKK